MSGEDDILGGGNTICQARRHSYWGTTRAQINSDGNMAWQVRRGHRGKGVDVGRMEDVGREGSLEEIPKTAREVSKWLLCYENFNNFTEYRTQES